MFNLLFLCFGALVRVFRDRRNLLLENLALRRQLAVLKRRHPRPRLDLFDRFFWITARQLWSKWKQALIVVTPETVVRWNRAGFRLYWRLQFVSALFDGGLRVLRYAHEHLPSPRVGQHEGNFQVHERG